MKLHNLGDKSFETGFNTFGEMWLWKINFDFEVFFRKSLPRETYIELISLLHQSSN